MKYQVAIKRKGQEDCDLIRPRGAPYECDASEAMARHDKWADRAQRGKTFAKCEIEHVFIQRVVDKEVMLATWPDGFQFGHWAAKGAAA